MRPLPRRGRASGRAYVPVEFLLGRRGGYVHDPVVLVESLVRPGGWHLVVGAQHTTVLNVALEADDDGNQWRLLDRCIRDALRHPFDRSEFCHKLLAAGSWHRDTGPGTVTVSELVWDTWGDLFDCMKEGK